METNFSKILFNDEGIEGHNYQELIDFMQELLKEFMDIEKRLFFKKTSEEAQKASKSTFYSAYCRYMLLKSKLRYQYYECQK